MSIPLQALDSIYPFVPTEDASIRALARSIRDIIFTVPDSGAVSAPGSFGVFLLSATVSGPTLVLSFRAERDGLRWTFQHTLQSTGNTIRTSTSTFGVITYVPERVPLVTLSDLFHQVEHARVRWRTPGVAPITMRQVVDCEESTVADIQPAPGLLLDLNNGANTKVSFSRGSVLLEYDDRGELLCDEDELVTPLIQSINGLTRPDIPLSVSSSIVLRTSGNTIRISTT